MPKVEVATCTRCGNVTHTAEVVSGVRICFKCDEEIYQVLAAMESRRLSERWAS